MENKRTHTPGPWEIVDQREMPDGHLLVVSPYDGSIASVTKSGGEASCLDGDANARLIAAAPDLLAAAKFALKGLDFLSELIAESNVGRVGDDYLKAAEAVRVVIAKAEGR